MLQPSKRGIKKNTVDNHAGFLFGKISKESIKFEVHVRIIPQAHSKENNNAKKMQQVHKM